MRIRLVLGAAVAVAVAGLVLDMSAAAPRTAGSDHFEPLAFTPAVPAGGTICQKLAGLPADAARVEMTIASYGKPMPAFELRFRDAAGRVLATGQLAAGAAQGVVRIPVRAAPGADTTSATEACLTGRGASRFAVGSEGVPVNPFSAQLQGKPIEARVSLIYLRSGSESWWELLPRLDERIGFGKARFFGGWLLPFAALALILVWAASIRLLARELR